MNTAFVERLNLSLRQRVAAIGRRSARPCKSENGLRHQLVLFQVYHRLEPWSFPLFHVFYKALGDTGVYVREVWHRIVPSVTWQDVNRGSWFD